MGLEPSCAPYRRAQAGDGPGLARRMPRPAHPVRRLMIACLRGAPTTCWWNGLGELVNQPGYIGVFEEKRGLG